MLPLDIPREATDIVRVSDEREPETLPELPGRKMPSPDDPRWPKAQYLTTAEVARTLGVTPRRVRQLIDEGKLKAERWGRDHLISAAMLQEYGK